MGQGARISDLEGGDQVGRERIDIISERIIRTWKSEGEGTIGRKKKEKRICQFQLCSTVLFQETSFDLNFLMILQ
jgi:hypothetical protein